jgi:hypothetical protein
MSVASESQSRQPPYLLDRRSEVCVSCEDKNILLGIIPESPLLGSSVPLGRFEANLVLPGNNLLHERLQIQTRRTLPEYLYSLPVEPHRKQIPGDRVQTDSGEVLPARR